MRCWQHPEKEAIRICCTCRKGICSDCVSEESDKLVCTNCAEAYSRQIEVKRIESRIRRSFTNAIASMCLMIIFLFGFTKINSDLQREKLNYSRYAKMGASGDGIMRYPHKTYRIGSKEHLSHVQDNIALVSMIRDCTSIGIVLITIFGGISLQRGNHWRKQRDTLLKGKSSVLE